MSRLCGRPTPKGPCKTPIAYDAIRCHRHMPKTEEEKAEYRAELKARRAVDNIRDEARFSRLTFTSHALEHGLADERTLLAYRAAKNADNALKQLARPLKVGDRVVTPGHPLGSDGPEAQITDIQAGWQAALVFDGGITSRCGLAELRLARRATTTP